MKRTIQERLQQCITLKKQLYDHGFQDCMSGIKEFSRVINIFIKEEEEYYGTIRFEEDPRVRLVVVLTTDNKKDCSVRIRKI